MSKTQPSQLDTSTRLAVERTRLAHERTLMAWVRTATSLISFGFTIYKFFEFELSKEPSRPVSTVLGPRRFAMIMIVVGILSLVGATIQDSLNRRALKEKFGPGPFSMSTVVAIVVGGLGVLALLAVVFRL